MTKSIKATDLSNREMYGYLSSAVAPRPICFASTVDAEGNVNLSPFSFFNVFSSNPPILVFSPVRRGRDNTEKDTLQNLREVKEVTISVVNYTMVEQMSLASTEYEKGVNEFIKAGFTPVESQLVKPPRVGESPVAFECKVNDIIELGNEGGAGSLVIAEVMMVHINDEFLNEKGRLDTLKLDLVARMGENWYARASGDALFEIPKPVSSIGIGVDNLPEHVRNSKILTGNNLGRLGTLERLPNEEEISGFTHQLTGLSIEEIHENAKQLIETDKAWEGLLLMVAQVGN
jgi:flavin reductase (DIM6/NTAB) family NADH-FMN oxidoreductase RutF